MNRSRLAAKSKRCSLEGVESIRRKPPASDHTRRPSAVRRVDALMPMMAVAQIAKAAKGRPHMVGQARPVKPTTAATNAPAQIRQPEQAPRSRTASPLPVAQSSAASSMASCTSSSFLPVSLPPSARNQYPGCATPSATSVSRLTGSSAAHTSGEPVPVTSQVSSSRCSRVTAPRSARYRMVDTSGWSPTSSSAM